MQKSRKIKIGKYILPFILFFIFAYQLFSEIIVTSEIDRESVKRGEYFNFIITVEGQNEKISVNTSKIKFPKIEGLNVLNSYTSSSHSYSFINGKTSTSEILKIFYQLVYLGKKRKIVIPKIKIEVNKKAFYTNPIVVKIGGINNSEESIQKREYFIKTELSKTNVYEFEPLAVAYSLYVRSNIRVSNINLVKKENFDNFFVHPLYDIFKQKPERIKSEIKILNGVRFRKFLLFKYELAPSKAGKQKIPSFSLQGILSKPQSFFDDDFFGFGQSTFAPQRIIIIPEEKFLNVKPLPPLNTKTKFSGIVSSNLKIENTTSKSELKAGEGLTYTVLLKGKVFKDFIKAPQLKKSDYFEIYDPEIKESQDGIIFKYLIIPKISGEFELPQASITYFDVKKEKYITLTTEKIKIKVKKSENYIYMPSEGGKLIKLRGNDIFFLKPVKKIKAYRPAFRETLFWFIIILSFAIFMGKIIFVLRERKLNSDQRLKRKLFASKKAKQWKKVAKNTGEEEFFDFSYKFLFDYLLNKLGSGDSSITAEKLIRDVEREFGKEIAEEIKDIFKQIEMAKFSPEKKANISELTEKIGKIIDTIEKR